MLLLVSQMLSAQSVTVSSSKLDELTQILESYGMIATESAVLVNNLQQRMESYEKIAAELAPLATDLQQRTSSLESGYAAYKQVVDVQLLPVAKELQDKVQTLELINQVLLISIIVTFVVSAVTTVIAIVK
jgi:hypothetical protein